MTISSNDTVIEVNREHIEWNKICGNYIFDKEYPEYLMNSCNSTTKTSNPIQNGQQTLKDISPKKICRWPIST